MFENRAFDCCNTSRLSYNTFQKAQSNCAAPMLTYKISFSRSRIFSLAKRFGRENNLKIYFAATGILKSGGRMIFEAVNALTGYKRIITV